MGVERPSTLDISRIEYIIQLILLSVVIPLTSGQAQVDQDANQNPPIVLDTPKEKRVAPNSLWKTQWWGQELFTETKEKYLQEVNGKIIEWEEQEEYEKNWNLESSQIYRPPKVEEKVRFIRKKTLKHLDRKLMGNINNAEKGSNLAKIGEVRNALRPIGKVEINSNYKVRFKARVLQGKAFVYFINPFFDWWAQVDFKGRHKVNINKQLPFWGLKTQIDYRNEDGKWETSILKNFTPYLSGEISSVQDHSDMMFSNESEGLFKLYYRNSF